MAEEGSSEAHPSLEETMASRVPLPLDKLWIAYYSNVGDFGALLARATAATRDPARHLSRAPHPASSVLVTDGPAPRGRRSSSRASAPARQHQLVTVELISDTM